jgi:hypothetical protein
MSSAASNNTLNLQSLKFTAAKKSLAQNPQAHRRMKLAKKLWEQIELAKAQQAGTNFTMTRFRTVTTNEGIRQTVEVSRRVRAWWWATDAGKLALNLRYGARAVEFSRGKATVEIATVAELVPTLELLKRAVEAGELDAQIEAASIKLREGFGK